MRFLPILAIAAGAIWFAVGLQDKVAMNLLVLVLLYAYWGVSWNLAAGFGGIVSLGHALFAGFGAYSVAYLHASHGMSPWLSAPIGVALAAACAAIIGFLSFRFRVRGHFFGLLTLAFAEIGFLLVSASQPLGRSDGIAIEVTRYGWESLQFRQKWQYALLVFFMLAASLILTHLLLKRRFGYYIRAVRDNEDAAEALGISAFKYKMCTIVLSAAMTALGGAFYALYISFVDPRSILSIELSVQILVFCIVGGLGRLWGPVLGAALLVPVGEFIRVASGSNLPGASAVVYALLLIFIAILLPKGVASLLDALVARRKAAQSSTSSQARLVQ